MKFERLWCCVSPDFVVQIKNFFSLVIFSAVLHKRRGKRLINKTTKYKLDSSSKIQFAYFHPEDIQKVFWKTINFVENLEMTQTARGRRAMFFALSGCNMYKYWYVTHHLIYVS